jgi:hypothetical protein
MGNFSFSRKAFVQIEMPLTRDRLGAVENRDKYENRFHGKPPNAGLQLRRAISIQA